MSKMLNFLRHYYESMVEDIAFGNSNVSLDDPVIINGEEGKITLSWERIFDDIDVININFTREHQTVRELLEDIRRVKTSYDDEVVVIKVDNKELEPYEDDCSIEYILDYSEEKVGIVTVFINNYFSFQKVKIKKEFSDMEF